MLRARLGCLLAVPNLAVDVSTLSWQNDGREVCWLKWLTYEEKIARIFTCWGVERRLKISTILVTY